MEKAVLRLVLLSAVCLLLFFLFTDNSKHNGVILDNSYEIIDTDNDDFAPVIEQNKGKNNIGSFAVILILSIIIILALSDVFVVKSRKMKVRRSSVLSDEEHLKQVTYRTYLTYLNSIAKLEQLREFEPDVSADFFKNLEGNLLKIKESGQQIVVKELEIDSIKIEQLVCDISNKPMSFVGVINARMQRFLTNSQTGELIEGFTRNKHRHCASTYFELVNNEWKMSAILEDPSVF